MDGSGQRSKMSNRMRKLAGLTLAGCLAITGTVASAFTGAPAAQAASSTSKDKSVARAVFSDWSLGSYGEYTGNDSATTAEYLYHKLIPEQRKTCSREGFEKGYISPRMASFADIGGWFDSGESWKVLKVSNDRKDKVWNGSKYITKRNSKIVKAKVSVYLDMLGDYQKTTVSMHVFNHKYFALGKTSMEDCEAATSELAAATSDLTGDWKQTNSDSHDSWQEAVIIGDTIEIHWVFDGGSTKSLYWAGSYAAPTTPVTSYVWESKNDHSKTDHSVLASPADTKTFTYANGVLSWPASALGTDMVIKAGRS